MRVLGGDSDPGKFSLCVTSRVYAEATYACMGRFGGRIVCGVPSGSDAACSTRRRCRAVLLMLLTITSPSLVENAN